MQINIRSSYDSFRDLRENDSYYIDKTEVIEEFLVRRFDRTVLFTRPRRFGKTLTMTMFRDFLDIRQDSRKIFSGLKVMEKKALNSCWPEKRFSARWMISCRIIKSMRAEKIYGRLLLKPDISQRQLLIECPVCLSGFQTGRSERFFAKKCGAISKGT